MNSDTSLTYEKKNRAHSNGMIGPLFILALPRSFTSVVCAMLGQHPQMYGLPETHLFRAETVKERQEQCEHAVFNMTHGLLRAIAQIIFGEQTEESIRQAEGWLRRRSHCTTGKILEVLAQQVYPAMLVDKSPGIARRMEFLQRAYTMFPQARFLHLIRHPRGQCQSAAKVRKRRAERYQGHPKRQKRMATIDPQNVWYDVNRNICEFFETLPEGQKFRVRGEDLLREPDRVLGQIAGWLGLRTDEAAIEEMKHPERSPFACFGPSNARFGNNHGFLEDPELRPKNAESLSLKEPLSWHDDPQEFLPKVKQLARQFGYK